MTKKEIEGAPSGETLSNSSAPMARGDYAEIVAHAIGDSAVARSRGFMPLSLSGPS